MLPPEHGFYQQNRPENGKVQYWCPNEKMLVIPVCLNGRCYSLGWWVSASSSFSKRSCQYNFLKYSKKGRLSSSYVGIRNTPSDVFYDNT